MSHILFQMHIMWYESKMLNETLNSIQHALQYSTLPVKFQFCLNAQTFIESPEIGLPEDMFSAFLGHPLLKDAELIYKTNDDEFYNATDWRREVYDQSAKYTVWGESDCLMPEDYFYILSQLEFSNPHAVTLASRKMWDNTWDIVEHEVIEPHKRTQENLYTAPYPLNSSDIINLEQLNTFNQNFDIKIIQLSVCKFDGALLALSGGVYETFIPENLHFIYDDTSTERFFESRGYPQYLIKTRIKGHNYGHPLKRTNTGATRNDVIYKQYADESKRIFTEFVSNLQRNKL